ncbi:hypothetical protein PVL29_020578 [Vitis rotundifolia]|uniref:Uncharacterized protein n=1 Tax=Vitis rotundifolia TaxID=103349 RepID=A0AA38YXC2_VITRO|nr:hypothetical protein PVL29_020578 [Vitis rotundifolia]
MARPQEQRRPWTSEEDNMLKEFKLKYPNESWGKIAELAELDRTHKSCWERWNNHLKPGVNKENFSQEEDDTIIRIQQIKLHRNKWAFMAENHLPGRAANDIKNRWNNHLKKTHAMRSYLERHLLTDDETSDHSVPGDDLESLIVEYASLIPNVDPNANI